MTAEEFDPFKTCKGCPDRDYAHGCEAKCKGKQYRKKKQDERRKAKIAEASKYRKAW